MPRLWMSISSVRALCVKREIGTAPDVAHASKYLLELIMHCSAHARCCGALEHASCLVVRARRLPHEHVEQSRTLELSVIRVLLGLSHSRCSCVVCISYRAVSIVCHVLVLLQMRQQCEVDAVLRCIVTRGQENP